jgi:hypothetical protein
VAALTGALAVLLICLVPSYYASAAYTGGQIARTYRTLQTFQATLQEPGNVFLTPGDPEAMCSYLGLSILNCKPLSYWALAQQVKTPDQWQSLLDRNGVNLLYADEDVLADPKRPPFLQNPPPSDWDTLGRQAGPERNWVLLQKHRQPAPPVVSMDSISGDGRNELLELTTKDPNGLSDIKSTIIIINRSFVAANACYLSHDQGTNLIWLSADDTRSWTSVKPGSTDSVRNGQCTLNGSDSRIVRQAKGELLRISLTFDAKFTGTKQVYVFASDHNGLDSGWQRKADLK